MFEQKERLATIRGEDDLEGLEAEVLVSPVPLGLTLALSEAVDSTDATVLRGIFERFGDLVLRSWNLSLNGNPIPASGQGVLLADPAVVRQIIRGWTEAVQVPLVPGGPHGNGHSPVLADSRPASPERH